jgi:hypothetical protein
MWDNLSDKRPGMQFTIAAGPHWHNHSWVQVLQGSWPFSTISNLRLPQPGGGFTHSLTQLLNGPGYNTLTWTTWKMSLPLLLWKHASLQSCYLRMEVIQLILLWSWPSNGLTCLKIETYLVTRF